MDIVWKEIKGFEGLYQAGSNGEIKALEKWRPLGKRGRMRVYKEKIMKCSVTQNGYKMTTLCRGGNHYYFTVHRLIAAAFHLNPLFLPEVNHIDANKLNNAAANLEWTTRAGNALHAYKNNLQPGAWSSEKNPSSRVMLHLGTGIFYESIKEAWRADGAGYCYDYFIRIVNKPNNPTNLIFA